MIRTSSKLLALVVALDLAACTVRDCPEGQDNCVQIETDERFTGDRIVKNTAFDSGATVKIDNQGGNGKVTVIRGTTSDQVAVTAGPVEVFLPGDTSDEAARAELAKFELLVGTDADGTVQVRTTRDGGRSTLAAELIVELPQGFDGAALEVLQDNGRVEIQFAGTATSVLVNNENGSTFVEAGETTRLEVLNGNGGIDLTASSVAKLALITENGDITAELHAITAHAEQEIRTDLGDIDLVLPSGTESAFSVLATAKDAVNFGTLPATCTEAAAAENSKTLTCNEGGTDITVKAEGLSGEVNATYQ
jgi:hypothetical protein